MMNPLSFFKKKDQKLNEDGTPAPDMSLGEKWYNRILYQGINYWLNLGLSLYITDVFLHGKGKGWYTKGVASATKKLTSIGLSESGAKWASEIALGTLSLNSGGNILLVPTKFAEDDKRGWVYWLNEKLGVDQTAADGHKMTKDEIYIEQEQDPQSWPRMIGRRLLGWGATTSVGMTIDHVLAKKIPTTAINSSAMVVHTPGQKVFTDGALHYADKVLKSGFIPGGVSFANNPTSRRYMGYAALDWIYTVITSTILQATNGAHKKEASSGGKSNTAPIIPVNMEGNESIVMPEQKPLAPEQFKSRDDNESFADALSKQSEKAGHLQMGA